MLTRHRNIFSLAFANAITILVMATINFYFRIILSGVFTALMAVLFSIISLFMIGVTSPAWWFARFLNRGTLFILGVKLSIEGREYLKSRPAILMVNHQSNMDAYLFGRIFPSKTIVIAKKQLLKVPFFGLLLLTSGHILIDRDAKKAARQALEKGTEAVLKKKRSLWVFPEGTRSKGGGLAQFRKGGFHIAAQSKAPIIPVVGQPVETVIDIKNKKIYGGVYHIKILEPVAPPENNPQSIQAKLQEVQGLVHSEWEKLSKLAMNRKKN